MTHDFKKFPELTNSQMQFYYFVSPHRQITENFNAKVIKVIDGDTIRVIWDERDFDFPIRLANIDAPEMPSSRGKQSKSWLEEQILNKEVEIVINPENRIGKWGRVIGNINVMGMNVNQLSLDFGFSRPFGSEII